jgi:hypothetical protein
VISALMLTLLPEVVLHEQGQPTRMHAPDRARSGQKLLSCHHRRLESLFVVLAVGEQVAQQT